MFALLRLAPAGGPWGGFMLAAWWRRGLAGRPAPGAAACFFPLAERWETCVAAGPSWLRFDPESCLLSVPLLPSQSLGWLLAAPDDWHGGVVGGAGAAAPLIGPTRH